MKNPLAKKFMLGTSLVLLFCVVFIIYAQESSKPKHTQTSIMMEELSKTYASTLFISFYSIDELRPYSIIQIDRISAKYHNNWLEPDSTANSLTKKERDLLFKKVVELIESLPDEMSKQRMIEKIKNWCNAFLQYNILNTKYGFSEESLLAMFKQNHRTKELFEQFNEKTEIEVSELSNVQKNKAKYITINYISNLRNLEQVKYYSEVMLQLSIASAK